MRKARSEEAGIGVYRQPVVLDGENGISIKGVPPERAESGGSRAFTVFGKVLGSLPISFQYISAADVFVYQYQYQDQVQEFCARPREAKKPAAVHQYARKADGTLKRGFDLLRLTLNLARGDLEAASPVH
ncbi:MAG: hypothetical protein ACE5GY_04185 [Thermodesulfobacteriota bacterium]